MTPPLVSVNLCCYNSERYLAETLESVLAQTRTDWELIVVDDGSTDATPAILDKYLAGRPNVIRRAQRNMGLGAARNVAIDLSSGRYLAFIDHDDAWLPSFLERVVPLLEADPRCALAYADAYRITGDGRVTGRFSDDVMFRRGEAIEALIYENFVSAFSSVILRKSIVDAAGRFDPDFHICEEYDLFLRMMLTGGSTCDFVAEPLVKYRWHAGNASHRTERTATETQQIVEMIGRRYPDVAARYGDALRRRRVYLHGRLAVQRAAAGRLGSAAAQAAQACAVARFNPIELGRTAYTHLYRRRVRRSLAALTGGSHVQ